jgi:hypothetical protein
MMKNMKWLLMALLSAILLGCGGGGGSNNGSNPAITGTLSYSSQNLMAGNVSTINPTVSGVPSATVYAASNLPSGLTLNASTGVISGTPTSTGTFDTTVTATATGYSGSLLAHATGTIATNTHPPITGSFSYSSQIPTVGIAFSITPTVSNVPSGTSYAAASLPAGLNLNASTGEISGTPTSAGYYDAVVTATASNYAGSLQAHVILTISASPPVKTVGSVPGWPGYIAMGAVAGPDAPAATATSVNGNDDFQGRPVDVAFKYAGMNGNGDPGTIDPPTNAYRMTKDFNFLSTYNNHATRVAIVEYTGQMSGGFSADDFTNGAAGLASGKPTATYLMARHFASLGADAQEFAMNPVVYNGTSYYGTLIMNPDLLGAIQQGGNIATVNSALPASAVNHAVAQAMCLLTTVRSYTNSSNPNGLTSPTYLNKTYSGTPVQILKSMLDDGYPVWSIEGATDPFWGISENNQYATYTPTTTSGDSQIEKWFKACVASPTYDTTAYPTPNFPAGFAGWVYANNWLIRTLAPKGTVTFGWQENMWAVQSGFWLHNTLSSSQINSAYSGAVSAWLNTNAPDVFGGATSLGGAATKPDYFLFDRYEMDDSASGGSATFYNARSWDNFLTAVGLISQANNNIPIMLWQIPGSHIPYVGESSPELFNNTAGSYVFSTAPVYFFGDSNLTANLSNMISGSGSSTNTAVGGYAMSLVGCGSAAYNCLNASATYRDYLLEYNGKANNYNWSVDNGNLTKAANANVFAILWGGGNTTNVIKNFSNQSDHGWLAGKIISYYSHPTAVVVH